MAEDINDFSGDQTLLDELNELSIGKKDDDMALTSELHRSNPVFDPDRLSSKVRKFQSSFNSHFIPEFLFQFELILSTVEKKVIDQREKAVVVSQYTSVLTLFENHLSNRQIKYQVLTGSTKIPHRQQIIDTFNSDSDEQVRR